MAVDTLTQVDKEIIADVCFEDIVDIWGNSRIPSTMESIKKIRAEMGWELIDSLDTYRLMISRHIDDLLAMDIQVIGPAAIIG